MLASAYGCCCVTKLGIARICVGQLRAAAIVFLEVRGDRFHYAKKWGLLLVDDVS